MARKNPGRSPAPVELDHKHAQSEHAESGSITFYETRGIRDSNVIFLFSDFEKTLSSRYHTGVVEEGLYADIFGVANHWLKGAGEKDSFAVREDAKKAMRSGLTRRFTFQRCWFEVGMKHGFLSRAAIAAKFISASDYVHRLLKGNPQLQHAVYQFADAWHWMHFELRGEHELAAIGLKSSRARALGPTVKHERADLKKAIVRDQFEKFAADDKNGAARKSAKMAAGALLGPVNQKLKELNVPKMAEKSLADVLRPLVNERFPKPR
jgi:hypothetical protein